MIKFLLNKLSNKIKFEKFLDLLLRNRQDNILKRNRSASCYTQILLMIKAEVIQMLMQH